MIKHGFQGALRSTIVLSRSGLRMTPAPFLRILKQASHQVPTCQMGTHRRKDPIEPLNSPQRARDFIYSLQAKERTCLLQELQTFESIAIAQDTGAPEEQGSREETSETVEPSLPTSAQIRYVVLHNAIPFVGFGFLDNAIMIAAGTQIEMSIGITFGISTMAAAALGNLVSDLAGLGLAGYVEALASRLGMHGPDLTPKQADMWQTRVSSHLGKGIGVTIGCILGMFPLFFLGDDDDDDDDEEKKKRAALQPASTSSPS